MALIPATTKFFSNLFIPQKNQQYSQNMFMANMLAIENWAKALNTPMSQLITEINAAINSSPAAENINYQVGVAPPAGTQPLILSASIPATAAAGFVSIGIGGFFNYGYNAMVCSGDASLCQVVAFQPVSSSLAALAVDCYDISTGAVTGSVKVNYILMGA